MSAPSTQERLCSIIAKALESADESVGEYNFEGAAAALSLVRTAQELYAAPKPAYESGRAITAMSDYEHGDPFERFRGMSIKQMRAVDNPIGRFVRDVVCPAALQHEADMGTPPAHEDETTVGSGLGIRMEIEFRDQTLVQMAAVAGAANEVGAQVRIDARGMGAAFVRALNERYDITVGVLPKAKPVVAALPLDGPRFVSGPLALTLARDDEGKVTVSIESKHSIESVVMLPTEAEALSRWLARGEC
jgi:hypothetical protein